MRSYISHIMSIKYSSYGSCVGPRAAGELLDFLSFYVIKHYWGQLHSSPRHILRNLIKFSQNSKLIPPGSSPQTPFQDYLILFQDYLMFSLIVFTLCSKSLC